MTATDGLLVVLSRGTPVVSHLDPANALMFANVPMTCQDVCQDYFIEENLLGARVLRFDSTAADDVFSRTALKLRERFHRGVE
ncbi:hypothetical protein ACFRQM_14200 [Streptomyces sp. NPDC056831]|uniref:hypothetical protein n=1 Tax=Streptomyces sp. NPDC056831 TaxID=3345954 RepID=UPI00369789BA